MQCALFRDGVGVLVDRGMDKPYIFKGFRCRLVKNDPTSRATPLLLVAHEKFIQQPFDRVNVRCRRGVRSPRGDVKHGLWHDACNTIAMCTNCKFNLSTLRTSIFYSYVNTNY